MKLKRLYLLLTGQTNATNPAKLTFRNAWAVIQSIFRKMRRGLGGFDLPAHQYEQIIWRRTQVKEKSPECWEMGECIVCGCDILGKTMEDRSCEDKCYPEMMNKEQWNQYKIDNEIKLFE